MSWTVQIKSGNRVIFEQEDVPNSELAESLVQNLENFVKLLLDKPAVDLCPLTIESFSGKDEETDSEYVSDNETTAI